LSQRAKRVLYFESEIERNIWKITIREILQLDQKELKNQYNLGSVLIGQGSFGKVFKGVCKQTLKPVAIKILPKVGLPRSELDL
jgi:serine/threonine protein kinase